MGTRSLTRINEGKHKIVNMYRQMDGYPSGHGKELYEFLKDIAIVDGISLDDQKAQIANGAGCLAAQMVAHFKDGPGGIYLEPVTAKDCGQDYEYIISVGDGATQGFSVKVLNYKGKTLFDGSTEAFGEFCAREEE